MDPVEIEYRDYTADERYLTAIQQLIEKDLSELIQEPDSSATGKETIRNNDNQKSTKERVIGVIICKLSHHQRSNTQRGYIAMLAVHPEFRQRGIGRSLVHQLIKDMKQAGADEIVLETECTNKSALSLYGRLGFVRDKRLNRYYLNGNDAFRLKLWFRPV